MCLVAVAAEHTRTTYFSLTLLQVVGVDLPVGQVVEVVLHHGLDVGQRHGSLRQGQRLHLERRQWGVSDSSVHRAGRR